MGTPTDYAYCREHKPIGFSEYLREWVIRGCPVCEIDRLRAEHARLQKELATAYQTGTDLMDKADRRIAELEAALLTGARQVEALKQPCSDDPESAQAIRNGTYMSIALNMRDALSGGGK